MTDRRWGGTSEQNRLMILDASSSDTAELLGRAVATFSAVNDSVTRFISSNDTLAFVEVDGEDIVGWCWGYVLCRPDGTAMAYLHELEVSASHRGDGVGTALVRAFASAASHAGAVKMFLTTGEANHAARRVYDGIGGSLAAQGPTVNYWFALPLN